MQTNEFDELLELQTRFRDERDWEQFHDSKNLALALSIEVAELNELFLWKKDQESEAVDREKLKEELADVFAYAILLATNPFEFNKSSLENSESKSFGTIFSFCIDPGN